MNAAPISEMALTPDWHAGPEPFRHTWSPVCNIDQFRWLSRADVLRQLEMARDELGVRHVRACAMFSPEMRVWGAYLPDWRKPAGEKAKGPNWQMIDIAIEGLLDLGLKPIYTTCFMPNDFTDDPTCCWPDKNRTGMPRDIKQWQDFVTASIRHAIARFGRDEVRSWFFECWNEPNLKGCFFGGAMEDFFRLWAATWKAVKAADAEIRFGGPSTARGEWVPEFLDFCAAEGCTPDYLITHVYNNDSEAEPLSPFDGPASHKVKDSPHFASGVVRGLRRELDRRGWRAPVHWNEWGRSWFPHDPHKETALEAAFIVKTMAEVSQEADAFAFWCLSDIYDQCGFQSSEFQANYGMLSLHGIRKPAWLAHAMLCRLGKLRVPCEGGGPLRGAVATTGQEGPRLLAWAYPEAIDAPPTRLEVRTTLPPGGGQPRLARLGAEENNILHRWRAMGAPDYPTRDQIEALRDAGRLEFAPAAACRVEAAPDGSRQAVFEMECPGIALLEVV